MNFQRKILIIFVISLIASVFAGIFIYNATVQIQDDITKLKSISGIRTEILNRANLLDEYLLYREERSHIQWIIANQTIDGLLEEAKKVFNTPEQHEALVSMQENNNVIRQTAIELFASLPIQSDSIALRQSEVQLIARLLINRADMTRKASQLATIVRDEISVTQQKLVISIGLIIALLLIIVFINLTWIRAIIKRLDETGVKDEAILVSIGDGLVVVDAKGKVLMVNKAFEELLGWGSEEVLGKLMTEVAPREDEEGKRVPFNERILSQVLAGKKVTTTTTTTTTTVVLPVFYYVRKDQTRFPASSIVTPFAIDGKIIGAVEIFRDITKEKAVDKAKTEFVSLASHQLRTPLSTVNWYAEMLLAGDMGKLNEGQKKYLDEVYHSNQRMIELVNALLNVSRIELGTFVIEPKPTDIVKLTRSVIDEQKPQIDEKEIKLSFSSEKDIPLIQADPKLLRMVVQNILSNAVKYTPEGGKIELLISLVDKKNIRIKISDTGYGIPKNQQDKIFTKLFRGDNVREKDTEGTGLGLYIVKSIIEHSAGEIWFESEENKGTTFYIALPLDGMKKKEGTKALS